MSMQTDCIYGYGFKVYVSDACLKDFILRHRPAVEILKQGSEILKWLDKHVKNNKPLDPLKEEFFDYENEATGDTGLYGLIADVMSKETGIVFEYRRPQDEDDDEVIILPQTYPWHFNEVEKQLTQDSLDEILKKYINELGGQLTPEHIRLEYFG